MRLHPSGTMRPMTTNADTPRPLWTIDDVADYLGVSPRTIHRLIADDPTFPPAIRVTRRALRWHPHDIEQWARSRQTHNTAAPAGRGRLAV